MKFTRIFIQSSFLLITCLLPLTSATEGSENTIQNEIVLFNFQKSGELNDWLIVNDGVMGGLSQSEIVLSDNNTAVFQGTVSLENNGGFSSTRTSPRSYNLAGFDGISVRLKGDGKKYQFRLRTNDRFDGIAYRYHFKTDINKWIIIRVPFNECVPVFRGRVLDDVEPISPNKIQQIGFLISDKQAGSFKLEIDWIKAYKK
jgi:NADH dehydrogenase [ubiquinone] 1 alpha subcomplex assembly factor 1